MYRDALGGVVLEHLLHQVDAGGAQLAKDLAQILRVPLRELVPVAQLGHARPHVLAGSAQQLEDVQQLLQLAVAGEDGLLQAGRRQRGKGKGDEGSREEPPMKRKQQGSVVLLGGWVAEATQ